MRMFRAWGRRVLLVMGLMVLIIMVMDLNSRIARLTHLRAQMEYEQKKLDALELEQAVLEIKIDYAKSDAAVEKWARQEGHLKKAGDTVVVPLPDLSYEPEPIVEEILIEKPVSNLEAWMQWLSFTTP